MSSSLLEIGMYITRYTLPIIYILGITANILNMIILRRHVMKQNSCVLYFFTLSVNNFVYVVVCLTLNIFEDAFGYPLSQNNNIICKFGTYLFAFCPHFLAYMLTLASIDRYFSSSLNYHRRILNNTQMARRAIIIVLIFNIIYALDNAIVVDIKNSPIGLCIIFVINVFDRAISISRSIIFVIILPSLMISFGLLTIKNIYRLNRNQILTRGYRHSEKQLTRMLLVQVFTHFFLISPFCILYAMTIIPPSFRYTTMFAFLFLMAKLPFYLTFITPFFLHILTSQTYRNEFFSLMKNIFRFRQNMTIRPIRGVQQ